jgi:hypothetical protein
VILLSSLSLSSVLSSLQRNQEVVVSAEDERKCKDERNCKDER